MRPTAIASIVFAMVLVFAAALYVQHVASMPVVEDGSISVVMCPACEQAFMSAVREGEVQCALYDVGAQVGSVLKAAKADVITDDETNPYYGKVYRHAGLMHHKFCVINSSLLLTGSYNPTDAGEKNKNNLLIITSSTLVRNYEAELQYLHTGKRGPVRHTIILNGTRIENYFCPADNCEEHVLDALATANTSIRFMTYSFTSDPIGALLLAKQDTGIKVEGICEDSQLNDYNECERLDAAIYDQPDLLHHKVFIVDERIVITGSYNPTANGNARNNENVLIIYDEAIAEQYLREYNYLKERGPPYSAPQ